MKEAVSNLRRIFPLRSCTNAVFRDYQRRKRPCIEYEMKRCLAPCVGLVDPETYRDQTAGTLLFLRGRSKTLLRSLEKQMRTAAKQERFEDAARMRETMQLLLDILEAPSPDNLEKFLSRIPMIFSITILSPHGWFGQSDVLGRPDTARAEFYPADQDSNSERRHSKSHTDSR